MRGYRIQFSW